MGKIQLKLSPWVASMLNEQGSEELVLERNIEDGTTIGDLLAGLALSSAQFRKVVFNPEVGTVSDQLLVILNNSLLPEPEAAKTKLSNGDNITLLPMYGGG